MNISGKAAISTAIIVVTLSGCSDNDITSAPAKVLDLPGLAAAKSVGRPWKGDCDVDAIFTSETTLLITGTCQLAHLGRTSVVANQTIVPGPGGIQYTNTATYTSANGDVLRTVNVGVATPSASGLSLLGIETAIGGTGRFANATGTATLAGAVQFTGPASTTGSYSLSGTLIY